MSLDERIRQLSETIIEEVRSPIEASLHVLLQDVMRVAAGDREQAVQSGAAAAAVEHDAALAALRTELASAYETALSDLASAHETALAALRAELTAKHETATASLTAEHEAATVALRENVEREHDGKLDELRAELTGKHEAALAALASGHETALAALASGHETALSALRAELTAEHERATATLTAEHEAATAALRENVEREHDGKLDALRAELTGKHEAALAALASGHETALAELTSQHQAALGELVSGHETALSAFRAALTAEHEGATAELTAEHEAATASLRENVEREHNEKLDALRAELTAEHEAALSELTAGHEARTATLREQFGQQRDAAISSARQQFEEARDEATRQHDTDLKAHDARAAAERESALRAVRDELGHAHSTALNAALTAAEVVGGGALAVALAQAQHGQHEAEARAAALDRELEEVRADATLAQDARQAAEQSRLDAEADLDVAITAEREQELACSDRTLAAVRQLDEARSLTGVLKILADQAASEIGRAAVLLVIDSRLRGWELRGLPAAEAAEIDAPIVAGTVFGRAIASGLPVSTSDAPLGADGDDLAGLLSVPPGRAGLAVPVTVGGRVVAILYADDADNRTPMVPSNWPEVAEILARHAGRCLELLTISHASVLAGRVQHETTTPEIRLSGAQPFADDTREEDSARRYARLLISEIKLYNESEVEQGRSERDLLGRLGPDIERARRLYEDKIPAAVRERVNCFDQELVRTLAGGDANLLGQQ